MIDRTYKVIEQPNGKKKLTVTFADKQYAMLAIFLLVEVESFEKWIKENFEIVMNGTEQQRDIAGNMCEVIITKESTKIYNMLAEDGMGDWCEIRTDIMLKLINEWCEKRKQMQMN